MHFRNDMKVNIRQEYDAGAVRFMEEKRDEGGRIEVAYGTQVLGRVM